jgi:hypothetical protein
MTTKIILRQHAVIPRSLNMAALAIDTATASDALGIDADEASSVMGDLSNASFEQVQRLLASKGLTLTLVPASMAEMVRDDRAASAVAETKQVDKTAKTLTVIASNIAKASSVSRMAANSWASYQTVGSPIDAHTTFSVLAQAASTARLALAIVSENSTFANCARVMPAKRGSRKEAADATFFDSLVKVAAAGDADGFRARPDLHVAALFDRMYFKGAAMRITFPDGEECDAYTSDDIGAAVGTLMGRVGRQKTAKELGLSLPMYDALATHPAGHRTTTLLGFLEKAGARVSAVKSERKLGWATAEEVRPALLRA